VMVVDDNRDSADTTTAILRLLGNQVECAYSGQDALNLAQRFKAHVVLLDLAMPGMDGFEALRRLRAVSRPCAGCAPYRACSRCSGSR
jgi:CheY-like chemotaxis protein